MHYFISQLKLQLPEFKIDPLFEDLSTVAASFLAIYITEVYENGDVMMFRKAALFVNNVVETLGDSASADIDEIAIGLYDRNTSIYSDFKALLSTKAQQYFDENISLWSKQ